MYFEKALDRELTQRLGSNAREMNSILAETLFQVRQRRDVFFRDNLISFSEKGRAQPQQRSFKSSESIEIEKLQRSAQEILKTDLSTIYRFYNREGQLVSSILKGSEIQIFEPKTQAVFLTEKIVAGLKTQREVSAVDFSTRDQVRLSLISRLRAGKKDLGYFQQIVIFGSDFASRIQKRLKAEVIVFREGYDLILSTLPEMYRSTPDEIKKKWSLWSEGSLLEVISEKTPYGFEMFQINWGDSALQIALGASKADTKEILRTINYTFLGGLAVVIISLLITVYLVSSFVLKPLYQLIGALQSFETQEQAVTVAMKNNTEIGLLADSFNEMSRKIQSTRSELKKKITELEKSNFELMDTQTKLVHSAKMVSLGQLVAGVAHELNNPIGFIYSNMTHLRDYSKKLLQLIETTEKHPEKIAEEKLQIDYDYIVKDLPKLITSCEDGARRTRDIVLGLRNFSRLEEAQLSELDVHVSLETTLQLLQGEIKNRIEVHKNFEPIPKVWCYASQINQVFMNILSNAVQAISGNGQIWIATSVVKDKSGTVQVSIQDSGSGMAPEILEKIFDPFFTTKGVGQGTGLGLSISYGIIQKHGGDIQVKSQVGIGTEFLVTIPLVASKNIN